MPDPKPLLPPSDLSPSLLRLVSLRFRSHPDLLASGALAAELRGKCSDLETSLQEMGRRLAEGIAAYASHSEKVRGIVGGAKEELVELRERAARHCPEKSGLVEALPKLAKEVERVETVREYADTTLRLDRLIGDVEDAVSSSMAGKRRPSSSSNLEEIQQMAMSYLKKTEDILVSVAKSKPKWVRLISAVDNRIDRALAVLRPQAIADHRSLVSSLGWPPKLSDLINTSSGSSVGTPNPLITMKGELKDMYCQSFLALCNLQEYQRQRKSRQLEGYNLQVALHQPLWAIEELANPISLVSQRHFSQWIEKPEFIFALVYKITKDFVDSMDEVLQPLVDKARLVGYSCREEWIAAIVSSLSTYLAKDVFPVYIAKLEAESSGPVQARTAWLDLIDSMISFDKRIQSLITNAGLFISVKEDESTRSISSLSVFSDRPDWLDIWAEMELRDTLDKLKVELENEKNWKMKIDRNSMRSGSDDYKSPVISSAVLQRLSSLVDRSRPLPGVALRSCFIKLTGKPILEKFLIVMLLRCQEAEGLTALADDEALLKVCNSINAARYSESVLMEWCEDVFFLEMAANSGSNVAESECFIFQEEICKLQKFLKDWLDKISAVILRGFDVHCREYVKNKKQWQEKEDAGFVSKSLVDSLDYLQGKILKMQENLNEVDFVNLWRNLAGDIDRLIFVNTLGSNVKFHQGGVQRFAGDLEVISGACSTWCLRPQAFFPLLCDGLRLLKMEKGLKEDLVEGKEKWLRQNGIRRLTVAEAENIAKNRVFAA